MKSAIQSHNAADIKVLLVDDDQAALEELKEIVELEGWEAITATSVDDALSTLTGDPKISVVVSDYHFAQPDGDGANGMQFVSRAQARFAHRDISYIFLSGDPDALRSSLQVGAFKFLSKPLLVDDFILAIQSASESGGGETESANLNQRVIAI